jgi:hypothetical protein
MEPAVKVALMEAGEEVTKTALAQAVKVFKAYGEVKGGILATASNGLELLHKSFLEDLADKINPAD